jgi:para-aminobenzoate synthetase component 1
MLGYEARSAVERTPAARRPPLGLPSLWLGRYDAALLWDHRRSRGFAVGLGRSMGAAGRRAERLLRLARRERDRGPVSATAPVPAVTPAAYRRVVRAARLAILRGEVFQANVSQRFDARVRGRPVDLFARLVEALPAPYMTFLDLGAGRAVLSASPERFLRLRGSLAGTDPMKGTRPRGRTPAEDRRLRADLGASAKERAELAMIVDLSRNDLARACAPGSVRVVVPRRLLRFASVHQAIGVVEGRLREGLDRRHLLEAAFPPGSVTGAPKVRATELIDELEGEGRGPYCGALGWFDEGGDMDLSVAIRTIVVAGRRATYRVGGGVTVGSDPEAERRETLAKGRGLFAALAGGEPR